LTTPFNSKVAQFQHLLLRSLSSYVACLIRRYNMPPPSLLPELTAEEVSQQCVSSMAGALACLSINIGHKLGLFQQLTASGPCNPAALAAAAGVSERWVREWCHQLAAARFISCDAQAAQFWLSEGQRAVLVEAGPREQPRTTPLGAICMLAQQ
jgi:hypothetical protein